MLSLRPSLRTRFVSLGSNPFCISAWVLTFEDRLAFSFFLFLLYVQFTNLSTKHIITLQLALLLVLLVVCCYVSIIWPFYQSVNQTLDITLDQLGLFHSFKEQGIQGRGPSSLITDPIFGKLDVVCINVKSNVVQALALCGHGTGS